MATQVAPLPTPPTGFGLNNLPYGAAFGSLGGWGPMYNDTLLDCVEAAAIHAVMYWTYAAKGQMAPFQNVDGRSLYSTWAGYVTGNPSTDLGTEEIPSFNRWMANGITDDNSANHKLLAYYQLPTGDVDALAQAVYLCGVVWVGFFLTAQWRSALANSAIWDSLKFPTWVGAEHTVPIIGRASNGNFIAVTYGGLVQMTPAGFKQFTYESYALVSDDYTNGSGRTPLGYTIPQLMQYMDAMSATAVIGASTALSVTPTFHATMGSALHATASLTVTPTISATASHHNPATAALTVTPSFSVVASHHNPDGASFTVTPTITAAATKTIHAAATVSVTPTVTTAATKTITIAASLTVTPVVTPAATKTITITASLTVTPTVTPAAVKTIHVTTTLTVTPTVTANGNQIPRANPRSLSQAVQRAATI